MPRGSDALYDPSAAQPAATLSPSPASTPAPAPVIGNQGRGADPLYDPQAMPSAPANSGTAPAAAPAQQGWGDYLLDHLHSFAKGFDAATRVATDAPTFGMVDKLFSVLPRPQQPQTIANLTRQQITGQPGTGNPYSPTGDPQADTAQAYKDVGYAAIPLSIAGSAVTGLPELKAASAIGEAAAPYIGKWAGGVLGSGAVGAGTGALGAYGHEQGWTPNASDIERGAAWGVGLGALSGVPGGVVRGGPLPASVSADTLKAQAQAAYKPLDNILFNGNSEVAPRIDAVHAALDASGDILREQRGTVGNPGLGKATMAVVNDIAASPQVTAKGIQAAQKQLDQIASRPTATDADKYLAPQFSAALEDVMQNGLPQTGVPAGVQPSGYAATVRDAGDVLHGRAQEIARLDRMVSKSKVTGGPDVGTQASSYLTSPQGQQYAPPGSPNYQAYDTLAGTAAKPEYIPWYLKHLVIAPAIATAAGEGYRAFSGDQHASPLEHLATDATLALGLMGTMKGYSAATGAMNRATQQRALDAARSTFSTGAFQAPLDSGAAFRNAIRALVYRQGDVGGFPR